MPPKTAAIVHLFRLLATWSNEFPSKRPSGLRSAPAQPDIAPDSSPLLQHPGLPDVTTADITREVYLHAIPEEHYRAVESVEWQTLHHAHQWSFYKKGTPPEREIVDVNEVIREMIVLLHNEANRYSIPVRSETWGTAP